MWGSQHLRCMNQTGKAARLPDELRNALVRAANELDLEETRTAIDRIARLNPTLARQLDALLERFEFERIVALCRNPASPVPPA